MINNRKPLLRFTGFSEPWEIMKLGDISVVSRGLTYKPENLNKKDILVLRSSNILEGKFVLNDKDVYVNKNCINIPYISNGDILVTGSNGSTALIGKHCVVKNIVEGSVVHGGFMLSIKSNNSLFLNYTMNNHHYDKFLNNNVAGSTIGNISKSLLESFTSPFPSLPEQTKIGNLFNNIDTLIEKQEAKYYKLLDIKKSLLNKMFPIENTYIPSIRFNGYGGNWEVKKLGEIAEYFNGKGHEAFVSNNGKYSIVNSKFVSTSGFVAKYTNNQLFPLIKGDITFVLSDVPNGKAIAKTYLITKNNKYTLNQRVACIRKNNNNNAKFLSLILNRNKYFLSFDDGAKQTNLSIEDVINFITKYPSLSEQTKIGKLFNSLDNLSNLYTSKINKLKTIKQSLLKLMFV